MKQQPNTWHALSPEEAVKRLGTDAYSGLSPKEANRRLRKCGSNAIWFVRRASVSKMALGEFLDVASLLLVITAAISAMFNREGEAVVLALILLVSALVRTVTRVAAQRIFEDAARTKLPRSCVVRDGKFHLLAADKIVPGDAVLLESGDPVTADIRLFSGSLTVSEIGVTENRTPVKKAADSILSPSAICEKRDNILFAGSTVLAGSARGIVVASGEGTYLFAKRGHIEIPAGEETSLVFKLSDWCRNISLVMIGAVLLITLGGLFFGRGAFSADTLLMTALSLAVASMSEFLGVLAAIILAASAHRLAGASGKTITVQNPDSLSRFAGIKNIVFEGIHLLRSGNVTLSSAYRDGVWLRGEGAAKDRKTASLLATAILCKNGTAKPVATSENCGNSDKTVAILQKLLEQLDQSCDGENPPISVITTACKNNLHTMLAHTPEGVKAYVCGSPADVIACCGFEETDSGIRPFSDVKKALFLQKAASESMRAVYTFAIAERLSPYEDLTRITALQSKMTFLGCFTVDDPIENSTVQALRLCNENGIGFTILTNSPDEDLYTLTSAGIMQKDAKVITATDYCHNVANFDPTENTSVSAYRISDREQILRAFREKEIDFAYISGAVSDTPLMRLAPASVAFVDFLTGRPQSLALAADVACTGKRGESAAEQGIRAVLTIRDLPTRLQKTVSYLLSMQALRLTLTLAAVFVGVPMLSPSTILWWGLILDFCAVLTFAFSPIESAISATAENALPIAKNGMLFPILIGILSGVFLAVASAVANAVFHSSTPSAVYSGAVFVSACILLLNLLAPNWKLRRTKISPLLCVYLVLVFTTLFFSIIGIHVKSLLCMMIPALLIIPVYFLYHEIISRD